MSRFLAPILAALALGAASVPTPTLAQAFSDDAAPSRTVVVAKDKSAAFRLTSDAAQVVVAQPEIAQIVANNDRSVYVRGITMGTTNILVYDRGHRLVEVIDVVVGYDVASIQADLATALPGERIRVSNMGGGVLLSGDASTLSAANRAKVIAERYAPKLVTADFVIGAAEQVMLEVRIIEANRVALKDMGVSLEIGGGRAGLLTAGLVLPPPTPTTVVSALYGANTPHGRLGISTNIGSTRIDLILDAMEEKGLIRTLARPNLAAISGEEASFLAGGEFPFPVPRGLDEVSIEFKPFGVQLKFTPIVQDNNLIRLKVAPEVSQLDNTNPLRLNGIEVPSLTIRRTSTTIELKPGETFAIAGLFQQDYANNARQVPGLGNVPVLGALFRSSRWRRRETELVVLVTPRLVTAAESRALSPDPLTSSNEPSAIDTILNGETFDRPMAAPVGGARDKRP